MSRSFTAHRRRSSLAAAAALDLGLSVRVESRPVQRTIFSGAQNPSAQALTSELSELVSHLRIRSFSLRAQLEEVTTALQLNVRCGFWPRARRAALDLGGLLDLARQRHLADVELCWRGADCAFRLAELCGQEAR